MRNFFRQEPLTKSKDTTAQSKSEQLKNLFDPKGFCLGTASAAVGRLIFYPVEATSFSLQIGRAKTVDEAIKLNFKGNVLASYKGGAHLLKSAILSSGSYYGLGLAVMNRHKTEPILVQAAWGLVTVLPEQLSVVEATRTVRSRNDLSIKNISRMGWARINAGFLMRHFYGNPMTFASIKSAEKILEEVVPEKYHPASSFIAGAAGVWATHRLGYSFLVAVSVQLMVAPEQSLKSAWKKAAAESYIKAGDIRAAGRMGTAAIVFCISKISEMWSKNKLKNTEENSGISKPNVNYSNFFTSFDAEKATEVFETQIKFCD